MSYSASPLPPDDLKAIIRDLFIRGATTETLADEWRLGRREVQRMVRGLAKKRPLSDDDIARFWAKVDRSDDPEVCWMWIGGTAKGRGQFVAQETSHQAHRVAYALTYGAVPLSKVVLQSCQNRLCVNPTHLLLSRQISSNVCGEDHPHARITNRQAEAIRIIRKAGVPYQVIGELVGLNESTIRKIVTGKRYANLPTLL
jgi:hypothetical protein